MRNHRILNLITLSALCTLGMQAQESERDFYVYGAIFQKFSHSRVKNVKAELLRTDSTMIDSMRTSEHVVWGKYAGSWSFNIGAQGKPSAYIVRLTKEGYDPTYINIPLIDFNSEQHRKEWGKYLGISEMHIASRKRPVQQLGEAVVKASKVAFYYKGDTLVYNASAFALAEGSMLDALIQRLDGVTLDENGEIKVNGRHIDKLLLNGKEFFDDNRQLMLDNLPSYMVKDVKVYEKETDEMRFMGRKREDAQEEMPYVMDVKLKKEFSIGWVANAEAGFGSKERYLGRLFLMRFSPRTQLVALGGINNLNDTRRPGQNSSWTPEGMPTGSMVSRTGGADFNFEDELTKLKYRASFTGSHSTSNFYSENASEDFITGGNTFGRSMQHSHSGNSSLRLNQEFSFETKKIRMQHQANASWWRNAGRNNSFNASFTDNPSLYISKGENLLDSIQGPAGGDLLRRLAVYRTLNHTRSHSQGGDVDYHLSLQTKKWWRINANATYSAQQSTLFNHYQIDHPYAGSDAEFQNRYDHNSPNRNASYGIGMSKSFSLDDRSRFQLEPELTFEQKHRRETASYYRLDRLAEWASSENASLGMLPTEADWMMQTRDDENSYFTHNILTRAKASLGIRYYIPIKKKKGSLSFNANLPILANRQWLDHARYTYDRTSHRNDWLVMPDASMYYFWNDYSGSMNLSYSMTQQSPDLQSQLIDFPNERDPLNISNGNPNLHRSTTHDISFYVNQGFKEKQSSFGIYLSHKIMNMAVARGYTYNRKTGVRYYRPQNVNGNYTTNASINFNAPLDKLKRLKLTTRTYLMHSQGVDLITPLDEVDGTLQPEAVPTRSTVHTWWTTEDMELRYSVGKFSIGLNGYAGYNKTNSKRAGFVSQNIWDYRYGLTLQAEPFWGINVSTDLKMYSRRGFSDPSGNRDDLVWNIRLSRTWGKPGLTFVIDGFDMLQQLSNRTFSMTTTGRWETYRNALPSYFVAHVLWRFNKKPKNQP